MARLYLQLHARPGHGGRDATTAPCGCRYVLDPLTDQLIVDTCADCELAADAFRLARETRGNVRALDKDTLGNVLTWPLAGRLLDLLKRHEALEAIHAEGKRHAPR